MSFLSLGSPGVALVEVCRIAWSCAQQAQCQHFLRAFSSVPTAVQAPPQRLLQLQLQLQHLLQHLRQLQPQLGSVPIMTQGLEIVAMNAAAARTQVVGLASCAKDRRLVTIVHLTVQAQVKTWPLHVWIGPSAAMQ